MMKMKDSFLGIAIAAAALVFLGCVTARIDYLYQSEILAKEGARVDSDKEFASRLLRGAFTGYPRYYQMIAEAVPKWDKDRLFVVDTALVITCLAEVEQFPDIPNKISVNEYVEISKYYSTPKSRSFVNGLLDNLIKNKLSLSL